MWKSVISVFFLFFIFIYFLFHFLAFFPPFRPHVCSFLLIFLFLKFLPLILPLFWPYFSSSFPSIHSLLVSPIHSRHVILCLHLFFYHCNPLFAHFFSFVFFFLFSSQYVYLPLLSLQPLCLHFLSSLLLSPLPPLSPCHA